MTATHIDEVTDETEPPIALQMQCNRGLVPHCLA